MKRAVSHTGSDLLKLEKSNHDSIQDNSPGYHQIWFVNDIWTGNIRDTLQSTTQRVD